MARIAPTRLISPATAALLLGAAVTLCAPAAPAADLTTAAAQHGASTADPARAGIWKAVMPPSGTMHGEFGGNDPLGLAAGAKIPADCSLNWVDPDYGTLYCFSTATSLVYFLESPRAFLARAQKNWPRLSAAP